jgi:biopolymer transport protein ExbD
MRIRQPTHDVYGINVIPMIDTMMFLLVFFLMATRFADIERDIRVKPPSSRNARPVTALPQELIINVERDGHVLVGGKETSPQALDALITQSVQQNPHRAVVVRGDKQAVLQYAVNVLDLCEKRGVERTYLTTSKIGPEK